MNSTRLWIEMSFFRNRPLKALMQNGVWMQDPERTYIDAGVALATHLDRGVDEDQRARAERERFAVGDDAVVVPQRAVVRAGLGRAGAGTAAADGRQPIGAGSNRGVWYLDGVPVGARHLGYGAGLDDKPAGFTGRVGIEANPYILRPRPEQRPET